MKRRFDVTVTSSYVVEIDDELFNQIIMDEWRENFYDIETPQDLIILCRDLLGEYKLINSEDGFANLSHQDAEKLFSSFFVADDVDIVEII